MKSLVLTNRVFLYGHFLDKKQRTGLPPPPPRPTVAIEIQRGFSPSELIGKIYVQTQQNWQPVTPAGVNSYDWFTTYRDIQQHEESQNKLYFQTPEKDYWEVIYFRQESDESGAYMAVALRHDYRYVIMTIKCPHCNTKQNVHVAAKPGFAQMSDQRVRCIKCKKEFPVMVPDRIIAGPFPT